MTVVTTSRKPVPEVRSLARDLAFAIGAEYATRGKMGMGDLLSSHDGPVLIVSRSGQSFLIQVFSIWSFLWTRSRKTGSCLTGGSGGAIP